VVDARRKTWEEDGGGWIGEVVVVAAWVGRLWKEGVDDAGVFNVRERP
jgi:hypothetical protein